MACIGHLMCLPFSRKRDLTPQPEELSPIKTSVIEVPAAQVEPQIPAVPQSLPSEVDKTLAECPQFRIVLVGRSGVGKSSLIKYIFNIDPTKCHVSNHRAGDADIHREFTSSENPRFILHDSKGFEPGCRGNWQKVEEFLQNRQQCDLPDKIHALWFCLVAPRDGGRLLHDGDEKLLKLAKKFNIPLIAIFTKYDQLENQFYRKNRDSAETMALNTFESSADELRNKWNESGTSSSSLLIQCVKVTTKGPRKSREKMLVDLIGITRQSLQDIERQLEVIWVAAQQVDVRQKVKISISEGFKKYWLDLSKSRAFEGQILIDCIHRLHEDVLKIWTFNDQAKILSGIAFFIKMLDLVKPLIENKQDKKLVPKDRGATVLVNLLQASGLTDPAISYLYDKYQSYPSTAKLLATYIVNLILVLHGIFVDTLRYDPPRALSADVVSGVVERHKGDLEAKNLDDINSDPKFSTEPEKVIESVINRRLSRVVVS